MDNGTPARRASRAALPRRTELYTPDFSPRSWSAHMSASTPPPSDEIFPHIVYRVSEDQAECALWRLADGPQAIALFLDAEAAQAYRLQAGLDESWQVFQPDRPSLQRLLESTLRAGIPYAVLNPSGEESRRIFDLAEVIKNFGQ